MASLSQSMPAKTTQDNALKKFITEFSGMSQTGLFQSSMSPKSRIKQAVCALFAASATRLKS
jgi:hypothetical protein